jgi:hypothetical protein
VGIFYEIDFSYKTLKFLQNLFENFGDYTLSVGFRVIVARREGSSFLPSFLPSLGLLLSPVFY